jgi:hypothetical protein
MKIDEAEARAKRASISMRFVITGENPKTRAEWAKDFAALLEPLAERGEITCGYVNVGGLGEDSFESAKVTVNITED